VGDWPHWLAVALAVPLAGGALTPALAYRRPGRAGWWALACLAVTTFATFLLAWRVWFGGPFSYLLGGWAPPLGIELRFDQFSAFAAVIAGLGLLVAIFARPYTRKSVPERRAPAFYALLLLNTGGMIGFVATGDFFNLFIFLEIVSLSAYALVALAGHRQAELAALKYLMMGAVSSVLVLLSIGVLHALTGSLNMADIAGRLAGESARLPALLALAGMATGFLVKAALFPVHIWLPDAHASAPSPVSAVLSGLVVKAGIIGLVRVMQVFQDAGLTTLAGLHLLFVWLGIAAILAGAVFALVQDDLKLMLAYSTVSNIGYIVLGLGIGTPRAVMGAAVHLMHHAVIKVVLFLAVGAIIHRTGRRTLGELQGVGHRMPVTAVALSIGILAIIGFPPTAGFLSKWYILIGAAEAGQPVAVAALVLGALVMSIYYVRILNAFHLHPPAAGPVDEAREAPAAMLVPVVLLAILCLVLGLTGRASLRFIEPAVLRLLGG
jgi:multicomponent Na+:H+ antiporter subunit D